MTRSRRPAAVAGGRLARGNRRLTAAWRPTQDEEEGDDDSGSDYEEDDDEEDFKPSKKRSKA